MGLVGLLLVVMSSAVVGYGCRGGGPGFGGGGFGQGAVRFWTRRIEGSRG
jgi:hypothetical protein